MAGVLTKPFRVDCSPLEDKGEIVFSIFVLPWVLNSGEDARPSVAALHANAFSPSHNNLVTCGIDCTVKSLLGHGFLKYVQQL